MHWEPHGPARCDARGPTEQVGARLPRALLIMSTNAWTARSDEPRRGAHGCVVAHHPQERPASQPRRYLGHLVGFIVHETPERNTTDRGGCASHAVKDLPWASSGSRSEPTGMTGKCLGNQGDDGGVLCRGGRRQQQRCNSAGGWVICRAGPKKFGQLICRAAKRTERLPGARRREATLKRL